MNPGQNAIAISGTELPQLQEVADAQPAALGGAARIDGINAHHARVGRP